MTNKVLLLGLPGSGRSRFEGVVVDHCQQTKQQVPEFVEVEALSSDDKVQVWTLLDIRSELSHPEAEEYLLKCMQQSSAVIFTFAEASDLSTQAFWQNWLKQKAIELPVMRWFSQILNESWQWQTFGESVSCASLTIPDLTLDRIRFDVNKLYLEHLLFGLDAIKQNLGVPIWRVKGKIQTQEYDNPVAIEGTINRWDTFAAESAEQTLEISGVSLDKPLLQEVVAASQLP